MKPITVQDLLGQEPAWLRCACGTLSTRIPCWTCAQPLGPPAKPPEPDDGIPGAFRWATLEAPELVERVGLAPRAAGVPTVSRTAKAILDHAGPAVVLVGPTGSGKTSLAVACMRERRGALFVPAEKLDRARIEHKTGAGEAPLVARCMRVPLLVIDDVGQDKPTALSATESVILERSREGLPTWITTGLGGTVASVSGELARAYNAGVARRLSGDRALVVGFVRKEGRT